MTIKCIDTYDRSIVEPLGIFSDEAAVLGDRENFPMIPPPFAEKLRTAVAEGKLPATRHPEDSMVWTDTELIVTVVWLDYPTALERCMSKRNGVGTIGLKSSVVVED